MLESSLYHRSSLDDLGQIIHYQLNIISQGFSTNQTEERTIISAVLSAHWEEKWGFKYCK